MPDITMQFPFEEARVPMSTSRLIVVLLIMIVLLLCEPQKKRLRALGYFLAVGVIGLAVFHIAPIVLKLLLSIAMPMVNRFGWMITISMAISIPFAFFYGVALLVAWRIDVKENRAIRGGDPVTIKRRVNWVMRKHGCSREVAVEAVKIKWGSEAK